jgi:enediyne biosynthesis protein E7
MARPPPGPKGESQGKLNYDFWQTDMFGFLAALAEHYGDIVGFDLGRSPCILVNGAQQVRELFLKYEACLRKPEFVKDSNRGHWGDGLTTLEGANWEAHRGVLRSCLGGWVSSCLPVVAHCTADMLNRWSAPKGKPDLLREFRILTARIAARLVLDADVEGWGPGDGRSGVLPFAEAYGEEHHGTVGGDPTAPLMMVRPRAPRRMDTTVRIINERIESGERRGDVLSDLIDAQLPHGRRLSRDEIVGEVMQMLYAGHLTIPSSLLNFWRDIAGTDVFARIAAEADHVCSTRIPELAVIQGSYCLAALKESMRLHPPAPILYREVDSPFELDGFEFCRDSAVWVSPRLLHHDADNFPEPHRFLPERFLKGSGTVTARSPYFPFGIGRRACVANQMVVNQMTLITLLAARQFRITPANEGAISVCVGARLQNAVVY